MKKKSLGRGLGEIFKEVTASYDSDTTPVITSDKDTLMIDVNSIIPNPYQPRKDFNAQELEELSQSIDKHGLIQPIVVVKNGDSGYVLVTGERRLRATKLLNHSEILAIVKDLDDHNVRELALIENIQREDLNPLELASSYKDLLDNYNISHEQLADIVHKSRASITNSLRLLTLSDYAKDKLVAKNISSGHARALIGLDPSRQKIVIDTIIGQNLTVREVEKLVASKSEKNSNKTADKKNSSSTFTIPSEEVQIIRNVLDKFVLKYAIKGNKVIFNLSKEKDLKKFRTFVEDAVRNVKF